MDYSNKKCDAGYYENKISFINTLTGADGSKKSYYSELKRKFSEIENNNLQLKKAIFSLESVSQLTNSVTKGMDTVFKNISAIITKIFNARYVIILMDDKNKDVLPFSIFNSGHIKYFSIIPENLQEIFNHVKNSLECFVDEISNAYSNIICLPIKKNNNFIGAIYLKTYKNTQFSEIDLHLLQILSNLFIISIENAQFIKESVYLQKIAEKREEEAELKAIELEKTKNKLTDMQKSQILNEERNRIATELHDSMAQILLTIGLNLEWCLRNVSNDNKIYQKLKSLQTLSQTTIYQLRNTIFELSIDNEKSFLSLLYDISKEFENLTGIKVKISVFGRTKDFSIKYNKIIYMVNREALYNIAKHAKATSVEIKIEFMKKDTIINISDNGIGISNINIKNAMLGATLGLKTMFERIGSLNGSMNIIKLQPKGTKILIKIPDEAQK